MTTDDGTWWPGPARPICSAARVTGAVDGAERLQARRARRRIGPRASVGRSGLFDRADAGTTAGRMRGAVATPSSSSSTTSSRRRSSRSRASGASWPSGWPARWPSPSGRSCCWWPCCASSRPRPAAPSPATCRWLPYLIVAVAGRRWSIGLLRLAGSHGGPAARRLAARQPTERRTLMAVGTNGRRITRDDLRGRLRQGAGGGEATAQAAMPQAAGGGRGRRPGPSITVAYLVGRRRGRRRVGRRRGPPGLSRRGPPPAARRAAPGSDAGVAGEHWAWLVVAVAAFVLRRARRPSDRRRLSVPRRARPAARWSALADPRRPAGTPSTRA